MTVYLLERGGASDRHLVGVYSTPDHAAAIAAMLGLAPADYRIDARAVDPEAPCWTDGLTWFSLVIDEVGRMYDVRCALEDTPAETPPAGRFICTMDENARPALAAQVWAPSRAHAETIVAGRRRALIAAGAWPPRRDQTLTHPDRRCSPVPPRDRGRTSGRL